MRAAWCRRQKIIASVMAIGVILLGAGLGVVFAPPATPLAPTMPSDARVGYTNAKLDQHFAGNPAGMDGLSWEHAYVFEGLVVERHGWSFTYTSRYVIIRNSTFRHLVDHGLEFDHVQHVRIEASTFLNGTTGISLEDSADITITNTSFVANGKALRVDGGANCRVENNSFAGNAVAIKAMPFTSGVLLRFNQFTGNGVVAEETSSVNNEWFQGGLGNYYGDYFARFPQATLDGCNPALAGLCDPAVGRVYVGSTWYPVSNRSTDRCPLVRVPMTPPAIEVTTPLPGAVVGNASAAYEVSITGTYVVAAWYTVGASPVNNSLGVTLPIRVSAIASSIINQTAWDAETDGEVTITFRARSITGTIGSSAITVHRDTAPPIVSITSPSNASAHRLPPAYLLDIVELHLASITCTIAGMSFPVLSSGAVPAAGWEAAPQGAVSIQYTVIDGGNNGASAEVMVFKDDAAPSITFTNMVQNTTVGASPPVIGISVIDAFAGVSPGAYYTVGSDPFQNPLTLSGGLNGTKVVTFAANISAWNGLTEGRVALRVTCVDELANVATEVLWLELDRTAPIIQVLAPLGDYTVGTTPGYFALLVEDDHLGNIWWSLDGGATTYPVTTWTGAGWAGYFTASEWAAHFVPGGSLVVSFFANDTLGNVGRTDVVVRCAESRAGAAGPLADFLEEPSTWLLLGIIGMLGVLAHAHYHQTRRLEARLR